jgi:TonB family protein
VAAAPAVTLASTIPTQVSGPAAAAPERNRDAIEKLFDSNRGALLDIYAHALDTDSAAHDGMLVHVTVDAGGKVIASSIKTSTAPNPSLDAEVLNSIATWDFGASSAGAAEADLPIIFSHAGTEASATESALSTKLAALSPSEPPELALAAASPTAVPTPPAVAALPPPPVMEAPPRPRHRKRIASARPPKPTLLEKVQDRLRVDPRTRRVKAYTNSGGVVTLYGKVFDDKARRLAVNNVQGVSGVNNVIDNLKTDTGEWQQQQDAIMRQLQGAGLTNVTVKVIGSDAFLDGQVSNALDRERAVTITQGAAPVKVRTNLIRVVPGGIFGF